MLKIGLMVIFALTVISLASGDLALAQEQEQCLSRCRANLSDCIKQCNNSFSNVLDPRYGYCRRDCEQSGGDCAVDCARYRLQRQ